MGSIEGKMVMFPPATGEWQQKNQGNSDERQEERKTAGEGGATGHIDSSGLSRLLVLDVFLGIFVAMECTRKRL